MAIQFKKATKAAAKLRLALIGVSGSGKTFSALSIARGLGSRIAVVDTEHGSAAKYADQFEFDTIELTDFDPANYIDAIGAAERAGYDVLVLDSLSHAWSGSGGILEQKDRAGGSFDSWRKLTPKHNALVDAIVAAKVHVIATMRSKQEYVVEKDDRGKSVPRKVGMGAVQRDGMEYEFDVVGMMDEAVLTITKTRYPKIAGKMLQRPGELLGRELASWLSDAGPAAALSASQSVAPPPRALVEAVRTTPVDEPLSVPTAAPAEAAPVAPVTPPEDVVAKWTAAIDAATTVREIDAVGAKIKAAGLAGAGRDQVATRYANRKRELLNGGAR